MEEMMRVDRLLVEKGLISSRQKARELVLLGGVKANGRIIKKVSEQFAFDTEFEIDQSQDPYVSRGGRKLEKAFEVFDLDAAGKTCLDAGASTGGFTHCLLQHGASRIYAVDVGSGQLAESLRDDVRVINMENTNLRYLNPSAIEPCDFLCADLSFISLTLLFEPLSAFLKESAQCVFLVKPQFEAGKENIGKGGIVKDKRVHQKVLRRVFQSCLEAGFSVKGLSASPIKGSDGNQEYLLFAGYEGKKDQPDVTQKAQAALPDSLENMIRQCLQDQV
ncbi:MAG: TlyA family RNA methyltransferase [Firmicutes bacterium]|nr:TlyA family RNA methyltransferase [Bacillota bacterium]